jgi:alanine dehydrogenase
MYRIRLRENFAISILPSDLNFWRSHMRIGVPKEIKNLEFRVGLTPSVVRGLTQRGHEVVVETLAGSGIGLSDALYEAAGARIVESGEAVFETAELIVKVKEPQPIEIARLKPHHTLFTYLHLAPDPEQARGLQKSGCTAIAYETVLGDDGGLPLLAPMSQVAGRMAVQVGAYHMLKPSGGRGVLIGGVPGVPPAKVVVLGGGVSGYHAAEMAVGLRADVSIFDVSARKLAELDAHFAGAAKTCYSTHDAVLEAVAQADLVVGCVLLPGAAAPKLVRREDLSSMRKGSVLVDVSIDQGGCFETSHPTTHADPIYEVDGIVHYCVANMPGAAPYTSTYALNAVTAPYVSLLADHGTEKALAADRGLRAGLNVQNGQIMHAAVSEALAKH